MGTRFKEARLNRCMFQEIPTSLVFTLIIWLRFERSIFYGEADSLHQYFIGKLISRTLDSMNLAILVRIQQIMAPHFIMLPTFNLQNSIVILVCLPGQWC
jgi:hypothetical protein